MNILYISQYFPPEAGATQTRAFENARYLVEAGHKVTVLCEIPNHPAGVVFPGYRGVLFKTKILDGIRVCYIRAFTSPQKKFITRLAFYFSFMAGAALAGMFLLREKFDLIYATSPPLPAAGAGLWLSVYSGTPLFFEVRDLWPDSAVALGELGNAFAIKMARKLESACYKRARKVVAVTKGIEKTLVHGKHLPVDKVKLIPNGATVDSFSRHPEKGRQIRSRLGGADRFVVLYAGILGIAQCLETLVEAADRLRSCGDVHFWIVGAGPKKNELESLVNRRGLSNISFLGEYPRKHMPGLYSAADAALVPLAGKEIFKHARPSKMFDAWACETPILLGIRGEARSLLHRCNGGLYYEPENADDLADKILNMKKMPVTQRRQMGRCARQFVEQFYSRQAYARFLEETIKNELFF